MGRVNFITVGEALSPRAARAALLAAAFGACTSVGFAQSYIITEMAPLAGYTQSFARGINAGGQIVGEMKNAAGTTAHGYRYSAGTYTDLLTLGGNSSFARDINDNGIIVGMSQPTGSSSFVAYSWNNGTMTSLASIAGGTFSDANAINNTAQIAGYATV